MDTAHEETELLARVATYQRYSFPVIPPLQISLVTMGKSSKNKSKSPKVRRSQFPVPPADQQPFFPSPSPIETESMTPESVQAYIENHPNFLEEMVTKFGPWHSKLLDTDESEELGYFYDVCFNVARNDEAFAKIPGAHLDLLLDHA